MEQSQITLWRSDTLTKGGMWKGGKRNFPLPVVKE